MRPSTNSVSGGNVGSICAAELAKVPFLLYPQWSNMGMSIDRFFKEIDVTASGHGSGRYRSHQALGRAWQQSVRSLPTRAGPQGVNRTVGGRNRAEFRTPTAAAEDSSDG
jgi:hypothetical protein